MMLKASKNICFLTLILRKYQGIIHKKKRRLTLVNHLFINSNTIVLLFFLKKFSVNFKAYFIADKRILKS